MFQVSLCRRRGEALKAAQALDQSLVPRKRISAYLLPELFHQLQVTRFLDALCGDWNWMRKVELAGVDYIRADVVGSVIAGASQKYARPVSGLSMPISLKRSSSGSRSDYVPRLLGSPVLLGHGGNAKELSTDRGDVAVDLHTPGRDKNEAKATGIGWRHLNLNLPPSSFPP